MVNRLDIAVPVERGTAGRGAGTAGAAQSTNDQLFPSEGADLQVRPASRSKAGI